MEKWTEFEKEVDKHLEGIHGLNEEEMKKEMIEKIKTMPKNRQITRNEEASKEGSKVTILYVDADKEALTARACVAYTRKFHGSTISCFAGTIADVPVEGGGSKGTSLTEDLRKVLKDDGTELGVCKVNNVGAFATQIKFDVVVSTAAASQAHLNGLDSLKIGTCDGGKLPVHCPFEFPSLLAERVGTLNESQRADAFAKSVGEVKGALEHLPELLTMVLS